MSSPEHIHAHAQSRDQHLDCSVHGNSAPVQKLEHHDHGNDTKTTVALILGGTALGVAVTLAILLHIVWAEYRVANLHLADMKAAMLAYGINPNPHLPNESP